MPPDFVGYCRCCECGKQILRSWGLQTGRRCDQCWRDRHPLATLEVINRSIRMTARRLPRRKSRVPPSDVSRRAILALDASYRRMATVFPDLHAMLLDEERVKRGLSPIAHYDPIDFEETASKTLAFEQVYDALDSEGVNDA